MRKKFRFRANFGVNSIYFLKKQYYNIIRYVCNLDFVADFITMIRKMAYEFNGY